MPNVHRGEYEVEIGGETRTFRYSLNKLANLQDKLGVKSVNELMGALGEMGFQTMRYLIWLGVAEYDPKEKTWTGPTEEEVGEWEIDIAQVGDHIKMALVRAFRGGKPFGAEGGDEAEEEDEATDPTTEETVTPASTTPS